MNNSIYIRRKNKLFVATGDNTLPNTYIQTLLLNIGSLGYTFSDELRETVRTLSIEKLRPFYKQLVADLKENAGAHVVFEPMYPNFPDQVKTAGEDELHANAFMHYLGDWLGQRIVPNYEKKPREPLEDNVTLQVIGLGTKEDFNAIFTKLLLSKTSISETDQKDIRWFVKTYNQHVKSFLPEEIPLKENIAYLLGCFVSNNIEADALIQKYLRTATDVLRLATAISEGDISLAENTKFKNISRKNRRLLLQALENCGNITEDMLRYKNRWKRLGEKIHPFEYKDKFPQCYEAFDIIRNDKPFQTFNGKVEKFIVEKDIEKAVGLLKSRPGELARRLDKLIRTAENSQHIIETFREVAETIATPVLLQVQTHFKNRNAAKELRIFFPKGNVGKAKAIDNTLPALDKTICKKIAAICEDALVRKFEKYKPLGKVYLDEQLKGYTVPFSQRSASKTLKTIARGSKIKLPPGDTIRFFIYWQDGRDRTDLDLSALALDTDSAYKTTIGYYNLKDLGGYHSGDITSAPEGASEFIDIEIPGFLESGIRYVLMSVNSFTHQAYCDLPVCFAGFMIRQFPDSGEIYDPLTVEHKFDLTANSTIAIPVIIDLEERQVIWVDLSLAKNPSASNNVHHNLSSLTIINKSMTGLVKPNLYDLILLHIKARGERTFDIQEANIIFAVDTGIKPTDIDTIVSEYL